MLAILTEPDGSILATPNTEPLLVNSTTFSVGAPEPSTIALLGVGLLGLGLVRRRAAWEVAASGLLFHLQTIDVKLSY